MNILLFKAVSAVLIVLYVLCAILFFARKDRAAFTLFAVGCAVNTAFIGVKWAFAGAPPFGTIYHLLCVIPVIYFVLALILRFKTRFMPLYVVLTFSAALPLVGTLFMTPPLQWKCLPVLQSGYFMPHVLAYATAYGLALSALLLTLWGVCVRWRSGADQAYSQCVYLLTLIAFIFFTFGLISGSLWAVRAWGSFWSWDPKETWGLITWMGYVIYFHMYRSPARAYAPWAQIFAFAALICTCFFVAFTSLGQSSMHYYG